MKRRTFLQGAASVAALPIVGVESDQYETELVELWIDDKCVVGPGMPIPDDIAGQLLHDGDKFHLKTVTVRIDPDLSLEDVTRIRLGDDA